MEEEKGLKAVIVDTYAMAMAYGELGKEAEEVMLEIRRGEITGYLPVTAVYELHIHWLRGRIPAIRSVEELKTFIMKYFRVLELKLDDFIESAKIKVEGDLTLRREAELKDRVLNIVDSTILWLALKLQTPIITGDRDLSYVAVKKGIKILW